MTDVQANVVPVPENAPTVSECSMDNMAMSTSPNQKYLQVPKIHELMDDGTSSPYTSEEEVLDHDDDAHNETTGEKDDENWVPPEDELVQKIIKQVEFYFSDANIVKDAFLLKHVRRNKEGYVSLKLITSFKKMKSLTKDWKAVRFSLQKSDKLITNREGTKVKRVHPLPEYDETTPSRSIVAVNLPMQEPTIEAIADLFSSCGEIALIRILRPGKPLPQDVKRHQTQHPELGTTVCAVVEFEKSESARKAIETLNDKNDWRNGMHVATLSKATPKKKTKNKQNEEKHETNSLSPNANQNTDGGDNIDSEEKGKRRRKKRNSRVEELVKEGDNSGFSSSSDVEASSPSPNRRGQKTTPNNNNKQLSPKGGQNHLSPGMSPKSSPHSSPRSSPRAQRRGKSGQAAYLSPKASPKASPELSRKKTDYSSDGSGSSSPGSSVVVC
ncbi:la-related protein 6-like [Ptychodera flava]|uniref:la-related protein 6-like n=1 Tax=Ptychodera flava TaxID=63121 RepID=UPI00396A3998